MKLEAVEALKQEIFNEIIFAPLTPGPRPSLGGIRARRPQKVPNLRIALGIGAGRHEDDFRLAVSVQDRKLWEDRRAIDAIIRRAPHETDVRFIGDLEQLHQGPGAPLQSAFRPLLAGSSVAHVCGTAGTIGLFPWSTSGSRVILSNNHVLALNDLATKGDDILQPGPIDGGTIMHRVGGLQDAIRIDMNGINYVDAAIASIDRGDGSVDPMNVAGVMPIHGIRPPRTHLREVCKFGRTTGFTRNRVSMRLMDNVDVNIPVRGGKARFDRVIEISASGATFSKAGDSGSVIFDKDGYGFGLLFAGNESRNVTYACDLTLVFRLMGLSLDKS